LSTWNSLQYQSIVMKFVVFRLEGSTYPTDDANEQIVDYDWTSTVAHALKEMDK